jgi:hypothetical protein
MTEETYGQTFLVCIIAARGKPSLALRLTFWFNLLSKPLRNDFSRIGTDRLLQT